VYDWLFQQRVCLVVGVYCFVLVIVWVVVMCFSFATLIGLG